MDEKPFASSKIHVVRDIEEALALSSLTGSDELDAWMMPHGANTMPKIAGDACDIRIKYRPFNIGIIRAGSRYVG